MKTNWVVKKVMITNGQLDMCDIYGPYDTMEEAIENMLKLKEIYNPEWDYVYDGGCYVSYASLGQLSISVDFMKFPELINKVYKARDLTEPADSV